MIATTDFFTPMVDDPVDFGRIAATNAISDVYAMGGRPILALAILGMPLGKIEPEVVARILRGGAEICTEAGIPVAGGHSIDTPEPIYGLAVIGTCRREAARRNADTLTGDNRAAFGAEVDLPDDRPEWRRHLLTDPQTSGGLLVACAADRADAILACIRAGRYRAAARIGRMETGPARFRVEA